MKTILIIIFSMFILFTVCFTACNKKEQPDKSKTTSIPTSGDLTIGIDESLRPAMDPEIVMFSHYYKDAHITPLYLPEKQVVEKLLNNEIQTGIICRNLNKEEIESLKNSYQHVVETFKLAEDAIVPVVNKNCPINDISYTDLKKILSGQITIWKQLNPSSDDKSPINMVMTASSSVSRYFFNQNGTTASIKSYALDTTSEVIEYLKNNPHGLGLLGGSWFYQRGDKYPDIKILNYTDSSSNLNDSQQHLFRDIYSITHEPFKGLGTGFISFIASQKGQMIIEAAGMKPFKSISREVQISHSFKD